MSGTAAVLPVQLPVRGRLVVVIGGGSAAALHAGRCLTAGARVVVVAPVLGTQLQALVGSGDVDWVDRHFAPGDLARAWLVVTASADPRENELVAAEAENERVFCLAEAPETAGRGQVTLVGGGPGDPGLLTLAGQRALSVADVVVLDRLAPRQAVENLRRDVLVIDVGKTPGEHPVPQREIGELLVRHAKAGQNVVRLKGGDPFVLGRGMEEVQACRAADVPVTVIPGVSSAFAVPAAVGIPVTHRGVARQVTVITGHEDADWAALAAAEGTLVVLMGVAFLDSISRGLLGHGKPGATPVAVIERGCTPEQRLTTGPLSTIAAICAERGVSAPAVIVIGAVAALAR